MAVNIQKNWRENEARVLAKHGIVKPPALVERVKTGADGLVAMIDPANRVDAETRERRIATCRECSFFIDGICQHCGCVMALKTWAKKPWGQCPVDKWGEGYDPPEQKKCGGCGKCGKTGIVKKVAKLLRLNFGHKTVNK